MVDAMDTDKRRHASRKEHGNQMVTGTSYGQVTKNNGVWVHEYEN
jgi:hypothetical protein